LAWQAIQDPTPENIGLILAARWDPFCVPVPWVPWPWSQWPQNSQQDQQEGGHHSPHISLRYLNQ